ncbi:MAG: hypothetical protein WBM53_13040 [Maribacter sp.]
MNFSYILLFCFLVGNFCQASSSTRELTASITAPIKLKGALYNAQVGIRTLKSSIGITSPNSSTIWNIPETAELEWTTKNISNIKSIRFFLAKDDMVVQELGTFKNTGKASGIVLAKNIGSGDNYQVVGIELFPDDKFHIAKFATPYFSIRNKESDARKNKANVAKPETPSIKEKPAEVPYRTEFNGRIIAYVKEMAFDNDKISVSIWDHGRQDGDIVSIYLNGHTVISKHLLTYNKKPFEIKLDPTKPNDLFLYAHNLGKYPPNTVSVEISDGKTSEKIILNSDLKSCEAVLISVNE